MSPAARDDRTAPVDISIVIPVYRGEQTLPPLIDEISPFREPQTTPGGVAYRIAEVVLVWDNGPDASDRVIRELADRFTWVRPVWLSRNFGQHAATVAGMAATGGDWIVTMDEDGQHDPRHVATMLDRAFDERADMVYGAPANRPPHGAVRNAASWFAKNVALRVLTGGDVPPFHSLRLVAGDVGRAVAAYAGPGVYLDVALSWVVGRSAVVKVPMRVEGRQAANYRFRTLISHFWRMVLSSGNRPLRLVSAFGVLCAAGGALTALWLVIQRVSGQTTVTGWTSTVVVLLVIGGLILTALGVIAEYVGLAASMSMGRPPFVAIDDPAQRFAARRAEERSGSAHRP